jgi:hypothetical protein
MTTTTRHTYIIVTDALKPQANALALQVDPTTSGDTFQVQLSASGTAPATHWGCAWDMDEVQYQRAVPRFEGAQNAWMFLQEDYIDPVSGQPSIALAAATIGLLQVRRSTI